MLMNSPHINSLIEESLSILDEFNSHHFQKWKSVLFDHSNNVLYENWNYDTLVHIMEDVNSFTFDELHL